LVEIAETGYRTILEWNHIWRLCVWMLWKAINVAKGR
jgi:hypothetical protein